MRVAQVIGKLAAAGVEAVVNNYYCSMNTERIQFDYFIDEDSELAPPQEMIDRGARYFVVPSTRHAAATRERSASDAQRSRAILRWSAAVRPGYSSVPSPGA